MAYLISDGGKRIQIETLSLAIASGFLVPPAAVVIEAALIFCWAFAESILDVRELFAGGHVPLVKTASDWQLSLSNLSIFWTVWILQERIREPVCLMKIIFG